MDQYETCPNCGGYREATGYVDPIPSKTAHLPAPTGKRCTCSPPKPASSNTTTGPKSSGG